MGGWRLQLSLRHVSIRVPWHDSGWDGTICRDPQRNIECLRLKNISANKNEAQQQQLAGRAWNTLQDDQLPPCVRERAGFMAPFSVTKQVTHPYADGGSRAHKHFVPTPLLLPAHSAPSLPFRWLLRKQSAELAEQLEIPLDFSLEERAENLMGFESNWLQDKRNQSLMLETFYSALRPKNSLVFFYAKQIPLVEDTRRILIGAGRVLGKGASTEYEYRERGPLESLVWERPIHHSIRPEFTDGFLLPYQAMVEQARSDGTIDPLPYVAFAPEEHWSEYSYATEHVTHDGALASLLGCLDPLRAADRAFPGDWATAIGWVNDRVSETWRLRGPCPGLGSALSALGIPNGTLVAHEVANDLGENENPWPAVEKMLADPSTLPKDLGAAIPTVAKVWRRLPAERQALLRLLSRFDLTPEQATRFFRDENRRKARIDTDDQSILENPYLIHELDWAAGDRVHAVLVDRGVFPDPVVRDAHPLPEPSAVTDPFDWRRVRGLTSAVLEAAARHGHTLLPAAQVIDAIGDMQLSPPCDLNLDLLRVVEEGFNPSIANAEMSDGSRAYQLARLAQGGEFVRGLVEKRISGRRLDVDADWHALLTSVLGELKRDDEQEARAREEKVRALDELASARISVLIGAAGTGKTTLLSVLTQHPAIQAGGVVALAPTGKARVQLERHSSLSARTIAQFLLKHDRYDYEADIYRTSDAPRVHEGKTVIIDEASMVTEEQLVATLDALRGVERLILVGDPRQLPPIGSGRPFVDIVQRLRPEMGEGVFPRVATGYCELLIQRRQLGAGRDDLLLGRWFSGESPGVGSDEIWNRLAEGKTDASVRLVSWSDSQDLQARVLETLVQELKLDGIEDVRGFEQSLGGSEFRGLVYFHPRRGPDAVGAGESAERWQIMSAVRGELHGVHALNRLCQRTFRAKTREMSLSRGRRTPRPIGTEQILYGDKVINISNTWKYKRNVYPTDRAPAYVANGEIGMVVGQFKGTNSRMPGLPWKLEVEFSTQPGTKIGYGDWSDDSASPLELAYALTVHKAQGSEFGLTLVVVPDPCRPLTRELLYTALTRQRERVVVLYQGDVSRMRRFADPIWSDTATRLTNLFGPPTMHQIGDRFLEEKLIHLTRGGELVRSKSEVVIADLLYSLDIPYVYEKPLHLGGIVRLPDFSIEDSDSGRAVYWEHLGLLHDPYYRRKWERKFRWYQENGVLPLSEGGGPNGALVETRDDSRGAISSSGFEQLARQASDWLTT